MKTKSDDGQKYYSPKQLPVQSSRQSHPTSLQTLLIGRREASCSSLGPGISLIMSIASDDPNIFNPLHCSPSPPPDPP